jgi:hypothetical protein
MTTPLRHEIYVSSVDSLTINDMRSVTLSPGVSHLVMIPGGALSPDGIAMNYADPTVNITSGDIATVVAATGVATGLVGSSAWEVQYEKRASGGAYAGSTSHVTLNGTNCLLYTTSISAQQDAAEGAEIQATLVALSSDGYTAPFAVNVSQSLTGTPDVPLRHALGPVYCNGSLIAGVTDFKLDTGIKIEAKRSDGGVFPVTCHVVERQPMVEFSVLNPALIDESNLGPFISALSGSGVVGYLQAISPGGGRVAGATGSHISITAATGVWVCTNQQGTARGDVVTTFQAKLTVTPTVSTTATLP